MAQAPTLSAKAWRKQIASEYDSRPEYLIPILQFIQADAGYLPPESMTAAARHLRIPESKVYGVASFYAQFNFEPQGEHRITICRGTACHVKGSGRIESELSGYLDVPPGGTTEDLLFTLESVACVGACALAPVVVVSGDVHADQSVASCKKTVDKLRKQSQKE
jgi:NADH-quinone oxidoreductase subunit E